MITIGKSIVIESGLVVCFLGLEVGWGANANGYLGFLLWGENVLRLW